MEVSVPGFFKSILMVHPKAVQVMITGGTLCVNGTYSWLQLHEPWLDTIECLAGCKPFTTWDPNVYQFYDAWRFLERTGVWKFHD